MGSEPGAFAVAPEPVNKRTMSLESSHFMGSEPGTVALEPLNKRTKNTESPHFMGCEPGAIALELMNTRTKSTGSPHPVGNEPCAIALEPVNRRTKSKESPHPVGNEPCAFALELVNKRTKSTESPHSVRSEPGLVTLEPVTLIQLDEPSDLITFDNSEHMRPVPTKQQTPLNPDLMCLFTPFTIDDLLGLTAIPSVPFSVKNFVHGLVDVPCVLTPGGTRPAAEPMRSIVEIEVIRDDGSSRRVPPVELNEYGNGKLPGAAVNRGMQKDEVFPVTVADLDAAFGCKRGPKEDEDLLLFSE
jgi:hypothetical protein